MARMARVVAAGYPHHITQRGNRRLETFFNEKDYSTYIEFISESCKKTGTECWAYCLMPNHVHLVLVPSDEDGLRASLGEAHRRYTRHINFREGWRGHLWQERFHSFPMDEDYLLATVRYVELNPVRARLVRSAEDWKWSSAKAHLKGVGDGLVNVAPMLDRYKDWKAYLDNGLSVEEMDQLRKHARTGRPLGNEGFVERVERMTGRYLHLRKPGVKKKDVA